MSNDGSDYNGSGPLESLEFLYVLTSTLGVSGPAPRL